ncbi:hypothetical protein BT93_I0246 [Corymbia citriodora subsp. variegata]|nr:hypothetical protein BT93_I0246 [Corymbia citriodora subsp. variegata]
MTSRRRKGFEPPESPHLFKIILSSDTLPGEKLHEIPKRFLRRQGSDLPGSVFLKVRSSTKVWPVELEWSDGMARLGQGWWKFRDYYSFVFGQLLVFRYEPRSVLPVMIFDMSASEIEYPADPVIVDKSEPECELSLLKEEESDDVSAKISEGCWPSPKIGKKSKKSASRASPAMPVACRYFKSKHPTFILLVYPSYLKNSSVVVTLKHEKDSWPVKLIEFLGDLGKLSQGWFAFARATSLCEGDVCVFKLTEQSPTVLKVSIFRCSDYT